MVLPGGQFRIVFTARDYQAAVAFYRGGLGLTIDHDWDYGAGDCGTVFIAGGGMVEIFGPKPGQAYVKPQGMGILIQVEGVDRWRQ